MSTSLLHALSVPQTRACSGLPGARLFACLLACMLACLLLSLFGWLDCWHLGRVFACSLDAYVCVLDYVSGFRSIQRSPIKPIIQLTLPAPQICGKIDSMPKSLSDASMKLVGFSIEAIRALCQFRQTSLALDNLPAYLLVCPLWIS